MARLAALDAQGARLFLIEAATAIASEVARGLPVGYLDVPYPRSGGVAVSADASLYVAADVENAI